MWACKKCKKWSPGFPAIQILAWPGASVLSFCSCYIADGPPYKCTSWMWSCSAKGKDKSPQKHPLTVACICMLCFEGILFFVHGSQDISKPPQIHWNKAPFRSLFWKNSTMAFVSDLPSKEISTLFCVAMCCYRALLRDVQDRVWLGTRLAHEKEVERQLCSHVYWTPQSCRSYTMPRRQWRLMTMEPCASKAQITWRYILNQEPMPGDDSWGNKDGVPVACGIISPTSASSCDLLCHFSCLKRWERNWFKAKWNWTNTPTFELTFVISAPIVLPQDSMTTHWDLSVLVDIPALCKQYSLQLTNTCDTEFRKVSLAFEIHGQNKLQVVPCRSNWRHGLGSD